MTPGTSMRFEVNAPEPKITDGGPHIHMIASKGQSPHLQVCYNDLCLTDPKHQIQTLDEYERSHR